MKIKLLAIIFAMYSLPAIAMDNDTANAMLSGVKIQDEPDTANSESAKNESAKNEESPERDPFQLPREALTKGLTEELNKIQPAAGE
jgi:hypothetical protein